MNPWYLVCLALLATSPAYAFDHDLFSQPRPRITALPPSDQPEQVRRAPSTPSPDLSEGALWLCSVSQEPSVNVAAFKRAKAKGWGYWSFAAHRNCQPGVYLTVVSGGKLKATGGDPWSDDPSPGDPLVSYTAAPVVAVSRAVPVVARPVYYASPASSSGSYCSDGSCYGSVSSAGAYGSSSFASGGCASGECGYSAAPTGWGSGGSSCASGNCGSSGGGRLLGLIFGGFSGGGGCASCGS